MNARTGSVVNQSRAEAVAIDTAPSIHLADIVPLLLSLTQPQTSEAVSKSLLWISHALPPAAAELQGFDVLHIAPAALPTLPFTQRVDLAVLNLCELVAVDDTWSQALTRLRDLLARQVLVVADPLQSDMLRALGFSQFGQLEQWPVWQFNILAYKQVPDWLNAKYWANPENFGKYRW